MLRYSCPKLLNQPRGRDFWCWPKEARPLGTRIRQIMIPISRFSPPTLSFYSKQNTKHKNKHSDTRIHTFANLIFITKINWYFCSSFSLFFLHCIVYKYRFPLYSWKKDFEQVMLHHCNMRTYQFFLSTNSSDEWDITFRYFRKRGQSHEGRFPLQQKLWNIRKGGKWNGKFQEKFLKNPKIGQFLNQTAHDYKYQMERKFQMRNFRKFGYSSRGCSLFRTSWKMLFHSQLEISGK